LTDHPVAIVGGEPGTALAISLGGRGIPVHLWMREADLVVRMRRRRDNPVYLPGVEVPEAVLPTQDLAEAARSATLVVFAVPTQFARAIYRELRDVLPSEVPVVVATKGIEEGSLLLPTQVAQACLVPGTPVAAVSGPFADRSHGARPCRRGCGFRPRLRRPSSFACRRSGFGHERRRRGRPGRRRAQERRGDRRGSPTPIRNTTAPATRGLAEMRRLGVALGGASDVFRAQALTSC
jgi:glycerol-3-phosphate dehydrogenase (NAD(P)+)